MMAAGAGATDAKARKVLELSRKLREVGDTPREAFSGEHAAAQSSMAAMGYELAGVFLGAMGGIEETPADKLAAAKSLAQQVLESYPDEAYGSAWLEQAIGLMGQCESELEEG